MALNNKKDIIALYNVPPLKGLKLFLNRRTLALLQKETALVPDAQGVYTLESMSGEILHITLPPRQPGHLQHIVVNGETFKFDVDDTAWLRWAIMALYFTISIYGVINAGASRPMRYVFGVIVVYAVLWLPLHHKWRYGLGLAGCAIALMTVVFSKHAPVSMPVPQVAALSTPAIPASAQEVHDLINSTLMAGSPCMNDMPCRENATLAMEALAEQIDKTLKQHILSNMRHFPNGNMLLSYADEGQRAYHAGKAAACAADAKIAAYNARESALTGTICRSNAALRRALDLADMLARARQKTGDAERQGR
jgi:hypothetical protein